MLTTRPPSLIRSIAPVVFLLFFATEMHAQITEPGFHYGIRAGVNGGPFGQGTFAYGGHVGLVGEYRLANGLSLTTTLDYSTLDDIGAQFVRQEYITLPSESHYSITTTTLLNAQFMELGVYIENSRWQWKGFSAGLGGRWSAIVSTTGLQSSQVLTLDVDQTLPVELDVRDDEILQSARTESSRNFSSMYGVGDVGSIIFVPRLLKRLGSGQVIYLDMGMEFNARYLSANQEFVSFGFTTVYQLGVQYLIK